MITLMKLEYVLSKLISSKTISADKGESEACLDQLQNTLQSAGLQTKKFASQGFSSLVASTDDSKKTKVILQAHIDVVPASDHLFEMKQEGGKLYGRGVFDMKFAAACFIKLAEELKDSLEKFDFAIMLTSDEEVGGENGVKMLIDEGYVADVCILPDGGDNWQIETDCNGAWLIKLTAKGKSSHGSRPWEGENAITNLIDALSEIREIFGESDPSVSSLTISQIEGGDAVNQVPGQATACLDMRFVDEADYLEKQRQINKIVSKHNLHSETVAHCSSVHTDITQPHVAKFLEIAENIRKKPLGQMKSYGASDARYFCDKGIPTILVRPEGGGAHSDEEWVDIASLNQYYEVLKAYVTEVAKKT